MLSAVVMGETCGLVLMYVLSLCDGDDDDDEVELGAVSARDLSRMLLYLRRTRSFF